MAVSIKRSTIEEIRVDCNVSSKDHMILDDFSSDTCWVHVREDAERASINLSKEDAKKVAEALLDWANS